MPECKYCEEEFESEQEMHIHMGEEHEDELNSHEEEKVKKAERKREEEQEKKRRKRRKLGAKILAAGGVLGIAVLLGPQIMSSLGGQPTGDFNLENQPMMGNLDANVTVVEFGDYQCPYCRQFSQSTFPQIEENYIDTGQVKFYWMNYAFLGQDSTEAAVAGECVHNQANTSQYWDFHKAVYANQGSENSGWVTTDRMVEIARSNTEGLDYDSLRQCINNQETISEVQSDRSQGSSAGVTGTPSVYVNGEKLPRTNYASIQAAIEQELN
ncbi:thioredoxin domain-containing protein [Nanohaloarchaea archaeon H01]|nr:thioredoxin domain-containing protein [Nanohaloarchaea archaeon H01]